MGQTRVRKTKPVTDEAPKPHRKAKLPDTPKSKLQDDENSTTFLAPPGSTIDSTSESLSFSKPSSESPKSSPDPDTVYIETKSTETKGQAVFATRKIQPGTLILSETPVIRLTQDQEDADRATSQPTQAQAQTKHASLEAAFAALSRPLQKSYLKLHDSQKSSFTRVASIYYSNCYNLTTTTTFTTGNANGNGGIPPTSFSPSQGGSCIGLSASRINHSCVPNVQFSYDEVRNLMLFHAIKPIARGKEILGTYDSVYEDRARRQRKQLMYYGFKCECEACEPKNEFWARSDERRRAMGEARREIKEWEKGVERSGDVDGADDVMEAMARLEGLLVKEGLVGLPLADLYGSMAKWAERKGDEKAVREWRKKEYDVSRTCLGERSPRVLILRAKLEGIEQR